jgi:lysyl-tRNA synthetase class 2
MLQRLKGWFQLDNLLQFNRKFFPEWQPRYVVVERVRDVPRVSVAALAAESYLPFQ